MPGGGIMPGGGKGGPPGPGGIIPGGGKPAPGGKGGRATESGKWSHWEYSGLRFVVGLTSTKPGRRRGSTESTRRTHAHGRSTHGRRTKMLGTEAETSRRGPTTRFVAL